MAQDTKYKETAYDHTRIFLQPIAAAAILGLFAFAGAMFVSGAQYAGWFPGTESYRFAGPFLFLFGGLAQFVAAMWAFRARDGLSTAFHGSWGAFWMALGLQNYSYTIGAAALPAPPLIPALGFWYVVLAVISAACALASLGTNAALLSTTSVTAGGTTLMAIGMFAGSPATVAVAGYIFILASIAAVYAGTAVLMEDTFGHSVLPLGEFRTARGSDEISVGMGEPGVLHGQWRLHHHLRERREESEAQAGGQ